MRIFIGFSDIASTISDLNKCFNNLGYKTFSVVDHLPNPLQISEVNLSLAIPNESIIWKINNAWFRNQAKNIRNYVLKKYVWYYAINTCNVFIFYWNSFNKDFSDLRVLRKLGKKIIFIFCGDDVRWYYASKQEFNSYGLKEVNYDNYDYSIKGLEERLTRLRNAEKYADFIFSRLDNAQLQLRPYYRYNMWVSADKIKVNTNQRKYRPKIVHAPSNRTFKGTAYFLDAVNRLLNEGFEFEVLLIENTPNQEVLKIFSDADIVVDQLIVPGSGKVSSEALAAGCVVLSHMAYEKYPQNNPKDCPIIDVNIYNIYDVLKNLILDYEFRQKLALRGPDYVKKNLDISIFCNKILKLVSGDFIEYDYIPSFFNTEFIPESEESVAVYNKWNKFVSDCDWYSKYVYKGVVNNLVF